MQNVELTTWNYFCFSVYELRFLTQFHHIAPTGPNVFLNRYNLILRWSWHFSMVLIDMKYVTGLLLVFPNLWSRVFEPSFSKVAIIAKKQVELNPAMALRIWVRTYLKVNHRVGDFGLLFICPSLDYLFPQTALLYQVP